MRRLLFALALALAATPARADPAETAPGAAPAASAQELIDQVSAQDLFEVLPTENMIVLRHVRSGLVCRMHPGNGNRLVVFPQAARGEDVACDSTDGRESVTFYATRFSFDTTLQEQVEGAEAAIRHRFPDARPYSSNISEAADSSLPASRSLQFLVTGAEGARMYTRASVALFNGWAIKMRYTVIAADEAAARQGERASEAAWRAALAEVAGSRRQ